MKLAYVASFALSLSAVASAQPMTSSGPAWNTAAASDIVSIRTNTGIVTSAEVQLRMCYQARIVPRTKRKFDYVVQDARQPGAGEMCGQAIRPARVAIAETGRATVVRVTTAGAGPENVTPLSANAIVRY
jgi:hypothetical protein